MRLTWRRDDSGDWTADGRYAGQWYELHRTRPGVWVAVFHEDPVGDGNPNEPEEYAFAIGTFGEVRKTARRHHERPLS